MLVRTSALWRSVHDPVNRNLALMPRCLLAGVRQRVEDALGAPLEGEPKIHFVREVAPNKRMLCISFRLPEAVALASSSGEAAGGAAAAAQNGAAHSDLSDPPAKRLRITTDAAE